MELSYDFLDTPLKMYSLTTILERIVMAYIVFKLLYVIICNDISYKAVAPFFHIQLRFQNFFLRYYLRE